MLKKKNLINKAYNTSNSSFFGEEETLDRTVFASEIKEKSIILNHSKKLISFLIFLFVFSPLVIFAEDELIQEYQIKFIRVYGGDTETNPPILVIQSETVKKVVSIGSSTITIEFDVQADVPPSIYAKFFHCAVDWNESDNVFLNDIVFNRTSNINWESAPFFATNYSWRGTIKVPDTQVKFNYPGNWKVKLFDYDDDSKPIAEARFFVLLPKVDAEMNLYTTFYSPEASVASSGMEIETVVYAPQEMIDSRLNTVVLYRNNRWFEPYFITERRDLNINTKQYRTRYRTMEGGIASVGKRFRLEGIPAENEYRILNLTNLAEYPRINGPVRLSFSDLRRNSYFDEYADDGYMTTYYVTSSNDGYIYLEFLLDPDGWISNDDVFVVGSFNNWKPSEEWMMYYDEDERFYKLRQWVRRGRHNYLYATGSLNIDTKEVERQSFEEYEGNTSSTSNTFISFIYYREFDYGGYDALVGVVAANIFGYIRK